MGLNGTKTKKLLEKALDAELRTGFRYRMIAEAARRENMNHIADIFEAIARNELEHARHEFDYLGGIGDIREVISHAIRGEELEATTAYPDAAGVAEEEGFTDIAAFFRRIGIVEARHEEHFRKILEQIEKRQKPEGRTVGNSSVEMSRVMQPEQANSAGFIHGGELMKFMDDAAAVVAARHSGTSVVTGSVEDISTPINVPWAASDNRMRVLGIAARRIAYHENARRTIAPHMIASPISTNAGLE